MHLTLQSPPGKLSLQEKIFEKKPDEIRCNGKDKNTAFLFSHSCGLCTGTFPLVAYFVLSASTADL